MKLVGTALDLTATDLSNFLGCRHRTALEMGVAHGKHKRPYWHDPLLEILFKRGLEHEKAYVESLRAAGRADRRPLGCERRGGRGARPWKPCARERT